MKDYELAEQFFRLYEGLGRAHGVYRITGTNDKGKASGSAVTVAEPVTIEKWREHLAGMLGLGIVPINDDGMVRWGAVDIDVYPLDLVALGEKIEKLDLPCVVLRTKSGGAHVALFANDWVPAGLMRAKMTEIAVALGHPGVEIFPKQVRLASERDFGNWLNMPYYAHETTKRCAVFRGHELNASQFLDLAKRLMVSADELEALTIDFETDFSDAPPCLQAIAAARVPVGSRNNAMFAFGVYCRLRHGDEWEKELESINNRVASEPLPSREMVALIKSLNRKNYFYPCKKAPCQNFCNREVCLKREYGIGNDDAELNVTIGPLVKINHKDQPTWIIDVDGLRFEIETDDLLQQPRFHKRCVDRVNKWPNTLKPRQWHELITDKLNNVEVIEPPPDSSDEGRFMQYVEQFCTIVAQAKERDEVILGKPWTDPEKNKVYFRSSDLFAYLDRAHFRSVNQRRGWDILRRYGVEHDQFQIHGRCVRVWALDRYAQQTAPHRLASDDQSEGAPF
jgi:hypothetical protein